ncbi:MAG: twin-arginine translocase TatA/TatE family subunit [Neisseriaceae bacterium]|nr:twin-arginine translocase TatA/TatE family subunit [Neisseriaceae bacterium]
MSVGPWQLILILVIVVLLFGTKKLRNLGSDVGGAIKGFKEGLEGEESSKKTPSDSTAPEKEINPLDKKEPH